MTRDRKIDIMLEAIGSEGRMFSPLYREHVDAQEEEEVIDLLMEEMIDMRLIKLEEFSHEPMGLVVLDFKGARIKESGGWLKNRFDAMSENEKLHHLLSYLVNDDTSRYDWSSDQLKKAFDDKLHRFEVEFLAERLISDDVVNDCRTKDGFSIGVTDDTRRAYAGKLYLKAQSISFSTDHQANWIHPFGDSFTDEERRSIHARLDDLFRMLERLEGGLQITYDDLTAEIQELKALTKVIGRKTWGEVFKGKMIDWGFGRLSEEGFEYLTDVLRENNLLP